MALFKKKNKENNEKVENKSAAAENTDKQVDALKNKALELLNEKLNGTVYDNCIIMRGGYTIDVSIGRRDVKEGILLVQFVFIVRKDDFDEPLIDPIDAQGNTIEAAAKMAAEIFYGSVWHPIEQASQKKNPIHVSVNYLMQHYDFDMYCQSVVRIGVPETKKPVILLNFIKAEIPKYLGSKKYYWIRIYLAKLRDKRIIEVRVNGSVCNQLSKFFEPYMDTWEESDKLICEKQYGFFVQREDDQCPFEKKLVTDAAKAAIEMMVKIKSREDYEAMVKKLDEMTGNKSVAAEVRIFIPEIFAKLTLGYQEGDSLFVMQDDSSIEIKKTQLRSYFYIQQVVLEYFATRPPKEDVQQIVVNSVAFRELKKAKEQGHEPKDLFVPGTSFKIGVENYKVW